MTQVVIEQPILNSAFAAPTQHFRFDEDGITNDIVEGRRESEYFMPVPASRKKRGGQLALETEWTKDRIEKNALVNQIRGRIGRWRLGGYQGVTPTTRRLLEYWTNPERDRKLFFCQIEALETAIYLTECASKFGDQWIANTLKEANDTSNPGLPRVALKMATGSGKTVVMAMLIAWQALNKLDNKQDARFADTFLVITPGITIRDRLRVLLPSDPENYYRLRDLLPADELQRLNQAKILITNFHAFQLREKIKAPKLNKEILGGGAAGVFTESPDEMVRRVCRELGTSKQIVVLNDEAHHCYRRKPEQIANEKLDRDEKAEARQREEEARIWIAGIEAVQAKMGVKTIYDLSATPFFLRGSGYSEGTLFPWVVSDFSLIDAIESGIVKVPRVPVADDSMTGELPTYRDLWLRIRDELPKKGRKTDSVEGQEPVLPKELEGALQSLYGDYEKRFRRWEELETERRGETLPPVFIVVCNNTNVSKMVYDHISGWQDTLNDQPFVRAGKLNLFRNDDGYGGWLSRPNTILVDSQQLESGEAMSAEFKQAAGGEIEKFKAEYRQRFPGRDASELTDEDLMREVMNTVGKRGRLGEHVRCVVSVSMLTEGWDANTVTHILGVRAFGTQLLCEQVVGRALRRMSYAPDELGMFTAEYAEVYGVPFSFIPSTGSTGPQRPPVIPTRVHALPERAAARITFPRLTGYRYEIPDGRLRADLTPAKPFVVSTHDLPSRTEMAGSIGETRYHEMYGKKDLRWNAVAFEVATETMRRYFRDDEGHDRPWLFPQVLEITKQWMDRCVMLKDNTSIGWLTIGGYLSSAAEEINTAIVRGEPGAPRLKPIMRPYDPIGSTDYVDFDTTKPTWVTDPDKCHVSHAVADTRDWEQKTAQVLEAMEEVVHYVKNEGLGFSIPYSYEGQQRTYIPDFIAHVNVGKPELLNLIVEVSGEAKKDKARKAETARDFWVPAVNGHGGFGAWSYVEVVDPYNAASDIRGHLAKMRDAVAAD